MDFIGTQDTILWYKNAIDNIDNTAFVKFKISNNFKQNFDKNIQSKQKSIGKSIPAYGF